MSKIKSEVIKEVPGDILNFEIIKKLEEKGINIIKVVGKGHRGIVFKGIYNNKKVAIKIPRLDAPKNTIDHEARILKSIEEYGISPKVYEYDKDYMIMEYIDGEELKSIIHKLDEDDLLKVIENILKITLKLDILGIDHGEIQGGRHFLVGNGKVYIIDFDKSRKKKITSKNFTRSIAMLFGGGRIASTIKKKLNIKDDEIIFIRRLAKIYKSCYNCKKENNKES